MKKDILNINVFNGDDGIKYIRYDDMISMLNRIKEDNEERDKEIERLNSIIKEVREFVEWHYKDNQEFYKNKGIGLNYPECDAVLEILDKEKEQ